MGANLVGGVGGKRIVGENGVVLIWRCMKKEVIGLMRIWFECEMQKITRNAFV